MKGSIIQLDSDTERKVREFFPVHLDDEGLEWCADWFMMMGINFVQLALLKNPHMTIGDVINISFGVHRDSH